MGNDSLFISNRKSELCSSMYASDMAYIVGILSRYLSNSDMDHWKAAKHVMKYLQRTKHYVLTYRRSYHLEIIGYSDFNFVGCHDNRVYSMS